MTIPEDDGATVETTSGDRGQVVLVAAAVVAVALLSMTLAYAHLGYDADRTGAGTVEVASASEIDRSLTASLRVAAREELRDEDGAPSWRDRRTAAGRIRESMGAEIDRLQRIHAGESRSVSIALADDTATRWARTRCPGGPGRDFGPCRAIGGIVVQERASETAVVAAAFRIRIVSPAEVTTVTTVSRTVRRSDTSHQADGQSHDERATSSADARRTADPGQTETD